jgi:hypothetical protein
MNWWKTADSLRRGGARGEIVPSSATVEGGAKETAGALIVTVLRGGIIWEGGDKVDDNDFDWQV